MRDALEATRHGNQGAMRNIVPSLRGEHGRVDLRKSLFARTVQRGAFALGTNIVIPTPTNATWVLVRSLGVFALLGLAAPMTAPSKRPRIYGIAGPTAPEPCL